MAQSRAVLFRFERRYAMSVPIPPPDQTPLWRRLLAILLLAVWPVGGFILLLGSAAGAKSVIGRGFAALVEAPWWAVTSVTMALVSVTLLFAASLRLVADFIIGVSSLALVMAWGLDPAAAQVVGTPLWGCLLFTTGVSLIDAGHAIQERRACPPPRSGNGA